MCIRGDAQNVDVPLSAIDTIAQQADRVNNIVCTGGEPTLNLPAIWHMLESFKKHRVSVKQIEIKTNGVILSEEITTLVKAWAEFIRPEWRYAGKSPVIISISKDKYHVGADPNAAAAYYTRTLGEYAEIRFVDSGDNPVKLGRARNLDEAQSVLPLMVRPRKICLWEYGQKPACPDLKGNETEDDEPAVGEVIVLCPLRITATGHLAPTLIPGLDYVGEDGGHTICDLSNHVDVLEALKFWNRRIPATCESMYLLEWMNIFDNSFAKMNTEQRQLGSAFGKNFMRLSRTPQGGLLVAGMLMSLYEIIKEK
jgi:hypothetical protein